LLDLLAKHGDSENTAMVRALIGCLSVVLRSQVRIKVKSTVVIESFRILFNRFSKSGSSHSVPYLEPVILERN
jgi:hypothetical protein